VFTSRLQEWVRAAARRVVIALRLAAVSPNVLTLIGLAVTAASAALIATGSLLLGGIVLLFASAFDILDGALARVTGKVYRYGAFLDSTSDRYAEGFTFFGLLIYFLIYENPPHRTEPMLVILALTGSLLVSYVRARAQSLGFSCDGGLLARPERVLIIAAGLIVPVLLVPSLWILAVLTNVTALQRIISVWRQSKHSLPSDSSP
jgi:phosphatidylglycerophosphate synthase